MYGSRVWRWTCWAAALVWMATAACSGAFPGVNGPQLRPRGEPLAALATQLRHGDWRKRVASVRTLGATRDPHAVTLLHGAMGDRDVRVRLAVVRACGVHRSTRLIPTLEKGLADTHRRVRVQAVRALARVGTRAAAVAILDGLDGASMWLRPEVADALAAMPPKEVHDLEAGTGILVAELDPRQSHRYRRLYTALVPGIRALLRALYNRFERNRSLVPSGNWKQRRGISYTRRNDRACRSGPCRALADMGANVLYVVLPVARVGVSGVHSVTLYVFLLPRLLHRLGKAAIPHMIALLGKSYGENVLATGTLSKLGVASVKPLMELLGRRGKRAGARAIAARLLGEMRDPRATGVLVAALNDPAPGVSKAAIGALVRNLNAKTFIALSHRFKSGTRDQRLAMVLAAMKQPGDLANRLLLGALVLGKGDAAALAAEELGERKVSAAVGALVVALGSRLGELREVAIKALGRIRDPRALAPLARLARRGAKTERLVAIGALGDLGSRSAVRVLIRLKRSRRRVISKAATDALTAIKQDKILAKVGVARLRVPTCDRYLVAFACYISRTFGRKKRSALNVLLRTFTAWKKIATETPLVGLGKTCLRTMAAWKKTIVKNPRYRGCFKP